MMFLGYNVDIVRYDHDEDDVEVHRNPRGFFLVYADSAYLFNSQYEHFDTFEMCEIPDNTDATEAWVVFGTYSDGDTFSTTYGYVMPYWVGFDEKTANQKYQELVDKDFGYFGQMQTAQVGKMYVSRRSA